MSGSGTTATRGGLLALVAIFATLVFGATAQAATINVNIKNVDSDTPTLEANCLAGSGDCPLRAAVIAANTGPDTSNTIVLPPGTYSLKGDGGDTLGGALHAVADRTLTIQGSDARTTVIDAAGLDRVLFAEGGSTVNVSGVTLRNGTSGSRIEFSNPVDLPTAQGLARNFPTTCSGPGGPSSQGGGIWMGSDSNVTLTDSAVSFNKAAQDSAGPLGAIFSGEGGGIYNCQGNLVLTRTTVHRNVAGLAGGGLATDGGTVKLDRSTFDENVVTIVGGGIANSNSQLTVDSSTFSGNMSEAIAGAIYNATVPSGPIVIPGGPGGLLEIGPTAPTTIVNSTFSDNLARLLAGGGIYTQGGPVSLTNDTIADDETATSLFGILIGPGIGILPTPVQTTPGAGIFAGGPVTVKSTILASSVSGGFDANCGGILPFIQSAGNNIDSGDTCGFDPPPHGADTAQGDQVNSNPLLDNLADNGGPTKTRALLPGSPAIDNGGDCTPVDGVALALDQRGGHRPPPAGSPGTGCDVGAFEANSLGDLSVAANVVNGDPTVTGGTVTYNVVGTNDGPDAINGAAITDPLPAGTSFVSASSGCAPSAGSVRCDLGTIKPQQVKTVKISVSPSQVGTLTDTATIGAAGITDTNPANDSATVTSTVNQPPATPTLPHDVNVFRGLGLVFRAPTSITLARFLHGFDIEAFCTNTACLRRFRENAAINTGFARIAGFNLALFRGFIPLGSGQTKIRVRPCVSGSHHNRPNRRCIANLTRVATQAAPFKIKVVVSAVDRDGHKEYAKRFLKVKP